MMGREKRVRWLNTIYVRQGRARQSRAGRTGWERNWGVGYRRRSVQGSQQDIGRGNMQAVQLRGLKALPQTDGRVDAGKVPPVWARRDRMGEEEGGEQDACVYCRVCLASDRVARQEAGKVAGGGSVGGVSHGYVCMSGCMCCM